jgi:hypothetical protein
MGIVTLQRLRLPKTSSVEESWRCSTQMRRESLSFHMIGFGDAHPRRILDA